MKLSLLSNRTECSATALTDPRNLENRAASRKNHPITFLVPAFQLVASISRFVE